MRHEFLYHWLAQCIWFVDECRNLQEKSFLAKIGMYWVVRSKKKSVWIRLADCARIVQPLSEGIQSVTWSSYIHMIKHESHDVDSNKSIVYVWLNNEFYSIKEEMSVLGGKCTPKWWRNFWLWRRNVETAFFLLKENFIGQNSSAHFSTFFSILSKWYFFCEDRKMISFFI